MPESARSPVTAPSCPHCSSGAVSGYGSFPLKDGTRQKRYRCKGCDRTFNLLTGTPLHYLKKRDLWSRFLNGIIEGWSVRRSALILGIHDATAFRWRHRLLSSLSCQPQPVLTASVAATEAFVPYSEKGSRRTFGPGAWGIRAVRKLQNGPGRSRFRRFIDGKPSCVLLASTGKEHAVITLGRGHPEAEQLCAVLKQVLGPGVKVQGEGCAPYEVACQRLGMSAPQPAEKACLSREVRRLNRAFYAFLLGFRGVATRYLEHYMAWYRLVRVPAATSPRAALLTLIAESFTPRGFIPVA